MKKLLVCLLLASFFSCGNDQEKWNKSDVPSGGGKEEEKPTVKYGEMARETYDAICRFYQIPSGAAAGLFYEMQGGGIISYLWPYDGMCSAFAAMTKLGLDVKYTDRIERYQSYYRNSGGKNVGGYGSSTDGINGGGSRFYDDNSIVGIELVDAFHITGDRKYLDRCSQIVKFLQSGRDDTFGGAMWWCEDNINQSGNSDSNKPACANGFGTWFLLKYYEVCPDAEKETVLSLAKEFYGWLYANLRDPEDNVYWNSKQADGSINKTKWTYNSGAMIASGVRLSRITSDQAYLNQAIATADGAYNYFVRSRNGLNLSYPTNDPWFTIQLIKSYIELEPYHKKCSDYLTVFAGNLDYAWEHGRDGNGLFYEDWTGKKIDANRDHTLLMQAAALESLAVVALYKEEKY